MRLRAIVFAGITSQAHGLAGCAPGAGEPHVTRRPPPRVSRAIEPSPTPGLRCRPRDRADPSIVEESAKLARAMLAYQPLVRRRPDGKDWVHALALHDVHTVEALRCAEKPLLSRAEDPYLLAAIQFHESSWRPGVVGRRGELGLMQVHGVALQGLRRDAAIEPGTNVRLGYEYLLRCRRLCGEGPAELWLGAFASGACDRRIPAAGDFLEATRALVAAGRGAGS